MFGKIPDFWSLVGTLLAIALALMGFAVSSSRRPRPTLERWSWTLFGLSVFVLIEMLVCRFVGGCSGFGPYIVGGIAALLAISCGAWPRIALRLVRLGHWLEDRGYGGASGAQAGAGTSESTREADDTLKERLDDIIGDLGLEVLALWRAKVDRSRVRAAVRLLDRSIPPEWRDEDPRADAAEWILSAINRSQPDLEPPMRNLACALGVEREYSSGNPFPDRLRHPSGLAPSDFGRLVEQLMGRLDSLEGKETLARAERQRRERRSRGSAVGPLTYDQAMKAISETTGDLAPILARLPENDLHRLADKLERSYGRLDRSK